MRTGPTPRLRTCFTASEAIVPAPITTTERPARSPTVPGELGAALDERVGAALIAVS